MRTPKKETPPTAKQPNKGGRPRKELTEVHLSQIATLAGMQCTDEEICSVIGISHDTLLRRKADPAVRDALDGGRAKGRASLRRAQWKAAQAGNATMLLWLGKQILGQSDKSEQTIDQTARYVVELPPETAPDTWQDIFHPIPNVRS